MSQPAQPQFDRLIPFEEVAHQTGIGRTQLYEMIARGEFPRPYKRGRSSRWSERAVQDWIAAFKAGTAGLAA